MGAEESIMKHEESKKTGEVGRTMDGYNTTDVVKNRMEPTINLKLMVH